MRGLPAKLRQAVDSGAEFWPEESGESEDDKGDEDLDEEEEEEEVAAPRRACYRPFCCEMKQHKITCLSSVDTWLHCRTHKSANVM